MSKGNTLKKISLKIILYCNIICAVLLIISSTAHFLNPAAWWLVALAGLVFPLLLLIAVLLIIFWGFIDRKKTFISLIAILLSIPVIKACFAFHVSPGFGEAKKTGNLRIVTWNVGLMNYESKDSATAADSNKIILDTLRQLDADVVCLQEFFTSVIPNNNYNLIDSISRYLHYPYHYFSYDRSQFDGAFYCGSIIFSKYKIIDSNRAAFPKPFSGSVIETGLLINKDTVNIITTRLQSLNFSNDEYAVFNNTGNASTNGLADTKNILQKIKYGYTKRPEQINIVNQLINKSRYPIIFTGDLNDVPSSYTYSSIKNNMSDAWVDKGFGMGRTFRFISPTLRIDYIFFDDFFNAVQTKRIITQSSDHYGLVTDLSFKKNGSQ